MEQTIYEMKGYNNRLDYLTRTAEAYGVELESVLMVADLLGSNEDFDGLLSMIDHMSY